MSEAGRSHDGEQVARLRAQRAALAEFGLHAFQTQDLDELLQEATALVSRALDVDLVKVLETLPDGRTMLIRAGVNWKPGVVGKATLGADLHSPAGYALQQNEPVISRDVSTEDRFEIPALLRDHGVQSMVNVIIVGNRKPFGVLEVDAHQQREFDEDDIAFLRNYANLLAAAIDRLRSHASLEQAVAQHKALSEELQHRTKNILALVQSLATQTAAEGAGEQYRDAFLGRLHALAVTHEFLTQEVGEEVALAALAGRAIEPYRKDRADAVTIGGPQVVLPARYGLTLGLVLHELATNAAKYGALSTPQGRVEISWSTQGGGPEPCIRLVWQEQGGPPVAPPTRRGFGTTMIEQAAAYQLDGQAELAYAPDGVRCELSFPLVREPAPG